MKRIDHKGRSALGPLTPLSERIRHLVSESEQHRAAKPASPKGSNLTRAFFETYSRRAFWERYARSLAHALTQEPVRLFDHELLVGMWYHPTGPTCEQEIEAREYSWEPYTAEQEIEPYVRSFVGFSQGHVGWQWDQILEHGVGHHMQILRGHLSQARDVKAKRLYRGALILWQAVLEWNAGHVAALRERARASAGRERNRLERLIDICRRVPRHGARNFHEAVQSFHFQHLAVMYENPNGGNGPGRVDYFLWPYLERDLACGVTTLEEARELVAELFVRFEERLHGRDGHVEAIMVGGTHPDGAPAANPLTYLMIDTAMALRQVHPAVYVRLSRDGPEELLNRSVDYLLRGENRAQIYNDEACVPAIVRGGVRPEDAAMYMAGGCMEIGVQGMNSDLNFATTFSVAKTLELVLNGGLDMLDGTRRIPHQRDLTSYPCFDDLYADFEAEISREYQEMVRALDIASESYARYRPCYLLSSLMSDCLEQGREQQDGGARYHDYGFALLGVTSVADSLHCINRAVYAERFTTPDELLAALRSNFAGYETLRVRLQRIPTFGVEDRDADGMCDRVLKSVCTLATRHKTRFGGILKPMVFNFVWTPEVSRELGARADGSRAGDSIGHGMTPLSRSMTEGITAAIKSCSGLSYDSVPGGATTMWDCDEGWISFDLLKALLQVFLARGGMIFQGNMTSVTDLVDAVKHPENHPNLIVRVGGFSAHFVALNADLQQEIISRRRHQR